MTAFYHYSLTTERFNELKQNFGTNELLDYLPNNTFKRIYSDALSIINNAQISKEMKMGSIRPLIESFLIDTNKVQTAEDIRKEIKKLDNKELESSFHKIVDDALKGVHIKVEKLNNDLEYILKVMEALFTKKIFNTSRKRKVA